MPYRRGANASNPFESDWDFVFEKGASVYYTKDGILQRGTM